MTSQKIRLAAAPTSSSPVAATPLQRAGMCGTHDPLELEADRAAARVMSMPTASAGAHAPLRVAGLTRPPAHAGGPPIVDDVLRSPGRPLDRAARAFMEPRFGHDFSHVRIHADDRAAESASAVNARAYTVGSHIVFGTTSAAFERSLLAHELAHVIQQSHALPSPTASSASVANGDVQRGASATSHPNGLISRPGKTAARISRQQSPLPSVPGFLTPRDLEKLRGFGAADYQASIDTLKKMLRITGDLTQEGLPRTYVATRQASGELRTFLDVIRNPDVQAVKVVPSASGGRSPDLYYGDVSGMESRVEVVNITAAKAQVRSELREASHGVRGIRRLAPYRGGKVVNTVDEINTRSKLREAIRAKTKPGSQLGAQNVNTQVAGRSMEGGGELRVSISHADISKGEIDAIIDGLHAELANSPATKVVVDAVDTADPRGGRKLFEYVPDEQRRFKFSQSRASHARRPVSPPTPGGDVVSTARRVANTAEADVAEHALADTAGARASTLIAQAAERDLAETVTEAFTESLMSTAKRRLAKAATPVIGVVFAAPDAWRGVQDLAHGDIVTGLGTIGVALVEVASQSLHATDEVTVGGGTALAITIQTWAAAMQFGFEAARIQQRSSELKAYMKTHAHQLPPRSELMGYYGLNDEDLLILDNDIYKAQQNTPTTEDLAKQVRELLAQIDANATKALPPGVTPEGIQSDRVALMKLLVALESEVEQQHKKAERERVALEQKRQQENFDRAQQQQKHAVAAPAATQLLPGPGVSSQPRQQAAASDPFGLFSLSGTQPLSGAPTMENAELAGTGFGRIRNDLLVRYERLEAKHFPDDATKLFQSDVTAYLKNLDYMIAVYMKKGSAEWSGVKEMRELRDSADNKDRSKLLR